MSSNPFTVAEKPLLPHEEVQARCAQLSTALASLPWDLSAGGESTFSAVADEIKQWTYDRVWDHPSTSYGQCFQESVDSLHQVLEEGCQKWPEDLTVIRAQTALQAFVAELSQYDENVGNLETYTLFERAEFACRITHWLIYNRFSKTASDRFLRRATSLHGSFLSKLTNTNRPWRETVAGLRTAIDGFKSVKDRDARSAAMKSLDELTKAAQEIEDDVTQFDPVRTALGGPLAMVGEQQRREWSVIPLAPEDGSEEDSTT